MQDRPTADELLAAIERFLDEEIVPNMPGSRGFHSRVAANTIRILRRELASEPDALAAEWAGLDTILGRQPMPARLSDLRAEIHVRNAALSELIRSGDADSGEKARLVFDHVRRTVAAKLAVSNPDLLTRGQLAEP
jgi:hypothetical protein